MQVGGADLDKKLEKPCVILKFFIVHGTRTNCARKRTRGLAKARTRARRTETTRMTKAAQGWK